MSEDTRKPWEIPIEYIDGPEVHARPDLPNDEMLPRDVPRRPRGPAPAGYGAATNLGDDPGWQSRSSARPDKAYDLEEAGTTEVGFDSEDEFDQPEE